MGIIGGFEAVREHCIVASLVYGCSFHRAATAVRVVRHIDLNLLPDGFDLGIFVNLDFRAGGYFLPVDFPSVKLLGIVRGFETVRKQGVRASFVDGLTCHGALAAIAIVRNGNLDLLPNGFERGVGGDCKRIACFVSFPRNVPIDDPVRKLHVFIGCLKCGRGQFDFLIHLGGLGRHVTRSLTGIEVHGSIGKLPLCNERFAHADIDRGALFQEIPLTVNFPSDKFVLIRFRREGVLLERVVFFVALDVLRLIVTGSMITGLVDDLDHDVFPLCDKGRVFVDLKDFIGFFLGGIHAGLPFVKFLILVDRGETVRLAHGIVRTFADFFGVIGHGALTAFARLVGHLDLLAFPDGFDYGVLFDTDLRPGSRLNSVDFPGLKLVMFGRCKCVVQKLIFAAFVDFLPVHRALSRHTFFAFSGSIRNVGGFEGLACRVGIEFVRIAF